MASCEGIFSKEKHSLRAKPYLRLNPWGTQCVSLRNRGWFSSLAAQWRHVSSHQSLCDPGHILDYDPLVWGHPRFFTSPQGVLMCRGTVGFILEGMGGSKRGIIYQTPSNTIYKEKLSTDKSLSGYIFNLWVVRPSLLSPYFLFLYLLRRVLVASCGIFGCGAWAL